MTPEQFKRQPLIVRIFWYAVIALFAIPVMIFDFVREKRKASLAIVIVGLVLMQYWNASEQRQAQAEREQAQKQAAAVSTPATSRSQRAQQALPPGLRQKQAALSSSTPATGINQIDGGMTSLMRAARDGRLESVQQLVGLGADVNIRSPGIGDFGYSSTVYDCTHYFRSTVVGMTPVMFAAYGGNRDVVKFLVEKGGDIHATDESLHLNAMGWAALRGHKDIVEYFLGDDKGKAFSYNAKVGAAGAAIDGMGCFFGRSYKEKAENAAQIIRLLLDSGVSMNSSHTWFKKPPITLEKMAWDAWRSQPELTKVEPFKSLYFHMIERNHGGGATVMDYVGSNISHNCQASVIMFAVKRRDVELVEALLKYPEGLDIKTACNIPVYATGGFSESDLHLTPLGYVYAQQGYYKGSVYKDKELNSKIQELEKIAEMLKAAGAHE